MEHIEIPACSTEPLGSVIDTFRLRMRESGSFLGTNLALFSNRVYGGQVFGQAIVAAAATLGEHRQRNIHSITAAFLRAGDNQKPINFDVEEVLDSRSFSTRRIHASQDGKTIFSARASFQELQPGVEHSSVMPQAPDPESLESSVDFFSQFNHPRAYAMHTTNVVDMRHVDGPVWIKPAVITGKPTLIWFTLRSAMPEGSSQLLHRAMLAYASDQFMLEPVMREHGMYWLNPHISLATLDHAIWWHRDVDMSRWVLAELSSPSAQGGRGLSIAKFFQDGRHVATMSQEGMVRTREL